jgi:hypothetical protein
VYLGTFSVTNALPVLAFALYSNNASLVKDKQFPPILKKVPVMCGLFAQIRFLIH